MKKMLNLKCLIFALMIFGFSFALPLKAQNTCEDTNSDRTKRRELPKFIYGVTVEDATNDENRAKIIKALQSLCINGQKPFIRIVFQDGETAEDYEQTIIEIHKVAFIVGEILDSQAVKNYSVKKYRERTKIFWDRFKNFIDIWEIANEINGEWVRPTSAEELKKMSESKRNKMLKEETKDVVDKIGAAFDIVNKAGGRTALTLYMNDDDSRSCYAFEQDSMLKWAETQISSEMKKNLDYVWVSYYDDPNCLDGCRDEGEVKLNPNWKSVFSRLENIFRRPPENPALQLGFGEIGTRLPELKADDIKKYYGGNIKREIENPKFTGGYFWWYFEKDMLPKKNNDPETVWLKLLRETIQASLSEGN